MTIRKRLILSYIAMLIVPLVLMSMMSGVFRFLFNGPGETGKDSGFRPPPFLSGHGLNGAQLKTLSRTIAAAPGFFHDPTAVRDLERDLGWRGATAILQGRELVYLNGYGDTQRVREELEKSEQTPTRKRHGIVPVFSWSFAVPGEADAVIHFFINYRSALSLLIIPGIAYLLSAIAILVFTNGFLTWLVSRSIVPPLRRLESMALRIRDGDLSPYPGPPERPAAPKKSGPARARRENEFERAFKSFEEMRARLKDSLERQLAQEDNRKELIAAISHDLRTPLAAIKGYAEGLGDGVASTEEKRRLYTDTILMKASLMESLIEDLFLFSRLELPDFPFEKKRVDLGGHLRDCVTELAADYPKLTIDLKIDGTAYPADIDPRQLRRAFANIVRNASIYVPGPDARLKVSIARSGRNARIEFTDNGPGIPAEDLERVFNRFVRLDPARRREGAGLGLAIARLVVQAHGGSIRAQRPEGGGARFVIELPLAEEENN